MIIHFSDKTASIVTLVQETTINQRLKFLIDSLSLSVRAFSEAIGESTGNTNNYIGSRKLAPKHEYLAKVLLHFSTVSAHWLLTGNGEPFLPDTSTSDAHGTTNTDASAKIFSGSHKTGKNTGIVGNTTGAVSQQGAGAPDENQVHELALARKEIEHLRQQLEMQAALLAAKEETITLLRASYNRPN